MNRKRIMSLILAVVMVLSCVLMSACKKDGPQETKDNVKKEKRTAVYSETPIEVGEKLGYTSSVKISGEYIFASFHKSFTVVNGPEGVVEEFEGWYYPVNGGYEGGGIGIFYDDLASSSIAVEVPRESEEFTIDGEPDEFGVIVDDMNNISVPEGMWVSYRDTTGIKIIPIDGGEISTVEINLADYGIEDGYLQNFFLDPDGNLVANAGAWVYDEETGEGIDKVYLITLDRETGEQKSMVALDEILKAKNIVGSDSYFYISSLSLGGDGSYYFALDDGCNVYMSDPAWENIKKIELDGSYMSNITPTVDGVMASYYNSDYTRQNVAIINNGQANKIVNDEFTKFMETAYGLVGCVGNRIYVRNNNGVTYYDLSTNEFGEEMNYINSDIDISVVSNISVIDEGKFLLVKNDWSLYDDETSFSVLTKVPDDEIKEEIMVKLATVYDNYQIAKLVIGFNKQNNGIRITTVSYNEYNSEENNWTGAVTQMNNDITAGKLPDIIVLSDSLPIESYFHKGVFADLNAFIDNPEKGINRADYLDNVFRANETEGKLYSIITTFGINELVGKSKYVGANEGWSFDDFVKAIKNMPAGMEAFWGQSKTEIISSILYNDMSGLVNWDTGDTIFASQGFIDFINYLKTCREKDIYEEFYGSMGDGEWVYDEEAEREMEESQQLKFWNDKGLFLDATLYGFYDIVNIYNNFASKDITFVGYPGLSGNGAGIVPTMEYAISAKSALKDEAWEFIKYAMSNTINSYSFSVKRSDLDESIKTAYSYSDDMYSYDNDIEWMKEYGYSDDYINFILNSRTKFDKELEDKVMSILEGAAVIARTDPELDEIINEELSAFFAGTKSAEDTARVIGSRAKIIISEKS